jgi:hypothetical protein
LAQQRADGPTANRVERVRHLMDYFGLVAFDEKGLAVPSIKLYQIIVRHAASHS